MKERVSLQEIEEEITKEEIASLSKLDSRRSRLASKSFQKKDFQNQVREQAQGTLDRNQEMFQLGSRYLEIMRDLTLPDNKGPLEKNIEQEVLNNLINFGVQLNNDENEPEGNGSVALISLLLKTALVTRDNYNKALFKISDLEKQIKEIKIDLKNEAKSRKNS